jgi:putative N-acetylmannosamine-6-phosphate epimerase
VSDSLEGPIPEGDVFIAPNDEDVAEAENLVAELIALHGADEARYVSRRDAACRELLGKAGAHTLVGPEVDEAASGLAALIDRFVARISRGE